MNSDDQTLIRQRYLWAVGLDTSVFPNESLLCDRYRVINSQIVLDTQIYKLPEVPVEIPSYVTSYLKLSRLPLNLPRPYGMLRWGEGLNITEILLLEDAPIDDRGQLLPTLEESWAEASALRQINWLWQVLQLWEPLAEQNMTLTLLQPKLVRVDGPWLRLLELQADVTQVDLAQLGDLWIQWIDKAQPEITEQLAEFFYTLGRGELDLAGAIAYLDKLAAERFQSQPLTIRIASATDRGPRRDHNEDTCYPDPDRQLRSQQPEYLRDRVAVICDGLGGHEGGEVASSIAIKTLEQQLQVLMRQVETDPEPFSPDTFVAQLEAIVRVVNNQLVALNDQQQRQAQQRMGTTLVMAVAPRPQGNPGHEIYVVYVGDSRAYWIDAQSCYQVTLDDDVATRETTLGYNFYAYSSQRVDGGALIQALGTRGSEMLLPRVQRFHLDEDCLLLLCSDGLSDYDRVDEIWQSYIRPILLNNLPLPKACQMLVEQANLRNGHDNATVTLMRFRLSPPNPQEDIEEEVAPIVEAEKDTDGAITTIQTETTLQPPSPAVASPADDSEDDPQETTILPKQTSRSFLVGVIVAMFLLGSVIAITRIPTVSELLEKFVYPSPSQPKIPPKDSTAP